VTRAERFSRARRERGSITLEVAVVIPAMLVLMFVVVQGAVVAYALSVVESAASAGVTSGRSADAGSGAGVARARAALADRGGGALRDVSVSDAGSTSDTVRITVSGRSVSVIPGLPGLAVRGSAHAPRERFTLPGAP